MQPIILLEVPKPCHEDWSNMTPEGRGRFCASCSKQVVDFSLMSDQQIINYFSNATGKTCGRFSDDQLKRPLIPVKESKKQTWWIAMMLPLLFFFEKSNAQKRKDKVTKGAPSIIRCEPKNEILGKVAFPSRTDTTALQSADTVKAEQVISLIGDTTCNEIKTPENKKITIKGRLTGDQQKEPIAFASIIEKGTNNGVVADENGVFALTVPADGKNISIMISAVGYSPKELPLELSYADSKDIIELNERLTYMNAALSGEVVVVGYSIKHKPVKKKDSLAASVRKIFRSEIFKAFPNPMTKGSQLNIQFKKAGDYTIQILNNSSRLIASKEYSAIGDAAITTIPLSPALAGGVYYVRVIDEKKKKQYTDKIIVQ